MTTLTRRVAHLRAGDVVTASIHIMGDAPYTVGPLPLVESARGLSVGEGWELVREPSGAAPGYLTGVAQRIVSPGLYDGIPDAEYHGGLNTPIPSLSQSLLKLLVPPSTPAHFRWRLSHPEPPKRVFDVGRAAHTRALGVGEEMVACPADKLSAVGTMTTNAAKAWAIEQRAAGRVPLTPGDYDMVCGMAEALVRHDRVADILTEPTRRPEVSAYAPHPDLPEVWFRGRFDLLGAELWDYKTARSAEPDAFRRSAWSYGYHVQDVLYRTLLGQVTGETPAPMVFIVQEKTPPYLVTTVQLDDEFERLARDQIAAALELYAACVSAEIWPGYPDQIAVLSPPAYADRVSAGVDYVPEF